MCLDKISATSPAPEGIGYKVFTKHGRFLGGEYTQGSRKTKTWLIAETPAWWPSSRYPCGFHLFPTPGVARLWGNGEVGAIVRKVKYRKAHTQGLQGWRTKIDVIVAQEIYIYPGEVK